jgi:CubicO group peptidase (beta-lactamase class C family)
MAACASEIMEDYCRTWNVPGAAVAVFSDRAILDMAAAGTTSLESPQATLTPRTLHRIHSVTKMLTCTAVLVLVDSGALSLDDEVRSCISRAHEAPGLAGITIRHLLTHTAGLGRGVRENPAGYEPDGELGQDLLDYVGRAGKLCEPGRVYDYSNAGIALLGYVVEQAAGRPFPRAMRETLFDAAGMETICFDPRLAMSFPLSQQHVRDKSGLGVRHYFHYSSSARPFAGAYCSVRDLARFGMWHLARMSRPASVFGERPRPQADLGLDIALDHGLGCYTGPAYGNAQAYGQIGYHSGAWAGITLLTDPPLGVAWCDNVGLDEVPLAPRRQIIEDLIAARSGAKPTWAREGRAPGPSADPGELTGVYRRPMGRPVTIGMRDGQLTVSDTLRELPLREISGLTFAADAHRYASTLPWRPHDYSSRCCVSFAAPDGGHPGHLLFNGTPYLRVADV